MTSPPLTFTVSSCELDISHKEYLVWIKAEGLSKRSQQAYEWHTRKLLDWLQDRGVVDLRQVNRLLLREWLAGLYDVWQPATIKQATSAAKSLLRWAYEEGRLEQDLRPAIKTPKVQITKQRTITPDELRRMIAVCDSSPKGVRDAAIMSLLFDSGLRSAELCRLDLEGLDLEGQEVKVQIKGGAVMSGWFGLVTRGRLSRWLAVREEIARPGVKTVFVSIGGTRPGTPLTPDGLRPILRGLGAKAGIPGVNTHAFRRGFACSLSAAGVADNVLKDLGRWSSTQMIKRYTLALEVKKYYQSPVDGVDS